MLYVSGDGLRVVDDETKVRQLHTITIYSLYDTSSVLIILVVQFIQ